MYLSITGPDCNVSAGPLRDHFYNKVSFYEKFTPSCGILFSQFYFKNFIQKVFSLSFTVISRLKN